MRGRRARARIANGDLHVPSLSSFDICEVILRSIALGGKERIELSARVLGEGMDLKKLRQVGCAGKTSADCLRSTGDELAIKDFFAQPSSWQDNWLVRDSSGLATNLTSLQAVTAPSAQSWLASEEDAFRARREQVFAAGRVAAGLATQVEYGIQK